ncbi:MAG: AbrB/MazE/SpoVT family DNA-binding domain-containing protein [Promethearchaeota archaeon]
MTSPVGVSKITRNFQVSIPPNIREKLKLKLGDYIAFIVKDEDVIIAKVTI